MCSAYFQSRAMSYLSPIGGCMRSHEAQPSRIGLWRDGGSDREHQATSDPRWASSPLRSDLGFGTHTAPKKRNASSSKPRREPNVPNSASRYSALSQADGAPVLRFALPVFGSFQEAGRIGGNCSAVTVSCPSKRRAPSSRSTRREFSTARARSNALATMSRTAVSISRSVASEAWIWLGVTPVRND